MKLTIIIPVFNEEKTIRKLLSRVISQQLPQGIEKEIIVIDDGSTDKTKKILKSFKKRIDFLLIEHKNNKGKGAAIKTGLKHAKGDFILIQDADLEYDPKDYTSIIREIYKNNLVIYGSRILGIRLYKNKIAGIKYYIGGKLLTFFINLFFKTKLKDQPTGFKLFDRKFIPYLLKLKRNRFDFEIGMTYIFSREAEIKEVPIRYYPRSRKEGKKITFFDFISSIGYILELKLWELKNSIF